MIDSDAVERRVEQEEPGRGGRRDPVDRATDADHHPIWPIMSARTPAGCRTPATRAGVDTVNSAITAVNAKSRHQA
jgi:hypothetical protein